MKTPDTIRAIDTRAGNLPLGIGAGLVAALLGAGLWMLVTVVLKLHIGFVALAIGAMVGYAVRVAGKGSSPVFGVAGAVLTLLGCVLGQFAAEIELAAQQNGVGFLQVFQAVDFGTLASGVLTGTGIMTYVIYAIGVYEGYKLSIYR